MIYGEIIRFPDFTSSLCLNILSEHLKKELLIKIMDNTLILIIYYYNIKIISILLI